MYLCFLTKIFHYCTIFPSPRRLWYNNRGRNCTTRGATDVPEMNKENKRMKNKQVNYSEFFNFVYL